MQEISKVHLGIPTLIANPGIKVIPTKGVLPPEEVLVQTPFYRIFMVPYNWRHSIALFCWQTVSPPALDSVFCVHRTAAQGDFSDEEIARIESLHGEIDRARRRVARLVEERGALNSLQHFVRDLPVPAVLLNWQLEPLYYNREGTECCARWTHGAAARGLKPSYEFPPELRAGCAAMKEQWNARRTAPRAARRPRPHFVHPPAAPGLSACISMLALESDLVSQPNFLIVFQQPKQCPPARRRSSSAALAALSRLTPRERDLAGFAGEGKSNGEIASALGCSLSTVKNGLYAVYKKVGVASRTQLMRKLTTA